MSSPLKQWIHPMKGRVWRAHCHKCAWHSRDLPFPDPDAALHMLKLHGVMCRGASVTDESTVEVVKVERTDQERP